MVRFNKPPEDAGLVSHLLCHFFGHDWVITKWIYSRYTVHNFRRENYCERCGVRAYEKGYSDFSRGIYLDPDGYESSLNGKREGEVANKEGG